MAPQPRPLPRARWGHRSGSATTCPLEQAEALTGIQAQLPSDPAIGPPDEVYVDRSRGNQVAFVWAASETLPETREPGIGLIVMRFEGKLDDGYRQKLIGESVTVERVTVDDHARVLGLW